MSATAAAAILAELGRKILSVKGDGNCLFRALGYYFYGTEMMHSTTRMLVTQFVATNRDRFKPIVMDGDIESHVTKMQLLTVWGTQVELQAAASLYQVPVYVLTFSRTLNRYTWYCYEPWDVTKLNFSETDLQSTGTTDLDHVELLHLRACHFDCILHNEGGFLLDRPVLEGAKTICGSSM